MKLTVSQLRKIIKEEVARVMSEGAVKFSGTREELLDLEAKVKAGKMGLPTMGRGVLVVRGSKEELDKAKKASGTLHYSESDEE